MREGRDVRGKYGGEGLVEEELGRELEVKGKSSNWRREKFVWGKLWRGQGWRNFGCSLISEKRYVPRYSKANISNINEEKLKTFAFLFNLPWANPEMMRHGSFIVIFIFNWSSLSPRFVIACCAFIEATWILDSSQADNYVTMHENDVTNFETKHCEFKLLERRFLAGMCCTIVGVSIWTSVSRYKKKLWIKYPQQRAFERRCLFWFLKVLIWILSTKWYKMLILNLFPIFSWDS